MKNIIKRIATIAVASMSAFVLVTAADLGNTSNIIKASAADVIEGVYVLQSAVDSSKVADVADRGTSNGCNLWLYERNNSAAQAFRITSAGNGYYTIQLAMTNNKVLDVFGGTGYQGCNVGIWDSNGYNATDNQLWSFESAGNGYYYIKSKTGFYLDVNGASNANKTNIQVWTGNNTNAQKWKLVSNYDVNKAVQYAQTYTDSSGNYSGTYNSAYNIYKKPNPADYWGFDCANFASQCIYAGGWVGTSQWGPVYRGEKYKGNTAKTTWVSADNLYGYLSSLGYPVQQVNSNLSNIHCGDIVFTGKGSHTTICTGISNGKPYYCAHSVWRKNATYNYDDFKNGYVIDMSFATCNTVRVSANVSSNNNNYNNTSTYTIRSSSGAKVRKSASLSGSQAGGLAKGSVVTYDQTANANGYTWYHIVSVDAKSGSWGSYNGYWVANV